MFTRVRIRHSTCQTRARLTNCRLRVESLEDRTVPSTGFIYYSDTGLLSPGRSVNHIKKANLDGTGDQTVLTTTGGDAIGGIAFDAAHGYLYSGDRTTIFRTNLDGTGRGDLASSGGTTADVELDLVHGKIYWSEDGSIGTIFRANLDGSNVESLVSLPPFNGLVEGLALDPVHGKLYFTDNEQSFDAIGVANLDGTNRSTLITLPTGSDPFDVEIDVANGKIYWNQYGGVLNDPAFRLIRRANLDGTGIEDLVSAGSNLFNNSIHFDTADQKIYYALASTSGTPLGVYRANADGTGQESVLNDGDGFNYLEVLHTAAPNAAPQVNAGPDQTVAEGSPFTAAGSFTDADSTSWTATVDYGDGSGAQPLALNPDKTFSLGHTYADNGSYTVTVSVTDNQGATGTDTVAVTVTNVPPSVSLAGAAGGVRGQLLAFAGSFTDPGTADTWTATVDFGDGSGTQALSFGADHTFGFNHIFAANGTYSVVVTVRDDDGGAGTASQSVTVRAVALQPDPMDPSKTALLVGGTTGNDAIQFIPWGFAGDVAVFLNGTLYTAFHPTGHLIAYGQAGDDFIQVFGLGLPALLDGGDGNDVIFGGLGDDVFLGGRGNDVLGGGSGRNLMVGGAGSDLIFGGAGEDILVAGTTAYDNSPAALGAVMKEWTRTDRPYAQRVADLRSGGGLNGGVLLNAQTVFSDTDPDLLVGGPGLDWFLLDPQRDRIADLSGGEIVDNCPIIHP